MWWKHIKFIFVLFLVVLMFIPAQILIWSMRDEPLFRNWDEVKEAYDMLVSGIYTK